MFNYTRYNQDTTVKKMHIFLQGRVKQGYKAISLLLSDKHHSFNFYNIKLYKISALNIKDNI